MVSTYEIRLKVRAVVASPTARVQAFEIALVFRASGDRCTEGYGNYQGVAELDVK